MHNTSIRKRLTRLARSRAQTPQPAIIFYDATDPNGRATAEQEAARSGAATVFLIPHKIGGDLTDLIPQEEQGHA